MKLPFKIKTRKQLKLEVEHLQEQLRIQGDERKKEKARANHEISELERQVNELNTHLSHQMSVSSGYVAQTATLEQQVKELKAQLNEANRLVAENEAALSETRITLAQKEDMLSGMTSSVIELKEKNKKQAARIKTLEEKLKAAKQPKPEK